MQEGPVLFSSELLVACELVFAISMSRSITSVVAFFLAFFCLLLCPVTDEVLEEFLLVEEIPPPQAVDWVVSPGGLSSSTSSSVSRRTSYGFLDIAEECFGYVLCDGKKLEGSWMMCLAGIKVDSPGARQRGRHLED